VGSGSDPRYDPYMARDYSRSAWDDLFLSGALTRPPAQASPYENVGRKRRDLGLPAMCLLAGVMVALLYVWPVLILTQLLADGMRSVVFWPIFAGSAPAAALVAWAITTFERGYWGRNWQNVSDWADPPPWK
jgi:hypothetical protein